MLMQSAGASGIQAASCGKWGVERAEGRGTGAGRPGGTLRTSVRLLEDIYVNVRHSWASVRSSCEVPWEVTRHESAAECRGDSDRQLTIMGSEAEGEEIDRTDEVPRTPDPGRLGGHGLAVATGGLLVRHSPSPMPTPGQDPPSCLADGPWVPVLLP